MFLREMDSVNSTLATSIPRFTDISGDRSLSMGRQFYCCLFAMSFAGALLNESANTSQFSPPVSHNLSAYSQDENYAVVPVDALYVDLDIPSADARTTTADKSVIDPGVESREGEGNDAQFTSIVKRQEVLYLLEKYCGKMRVEMKRYEPICNLANRISRQSNTPSVRENPKVIEGVCKSKRKSDTIGIWDGRATVANKRSGWRKNYDERDPPVNGMAGQKDEAGREGTDGKGTDGSEKKDVNRLVPRDWKYIRHVVEFEKSNKTYCILVTRTLSASTLDFKWLVGPVKRKHRNFPPKVYLARAIDDLLTFRWRTLSYNEMFKPVNRICRAIGMDRLVPLGYVKRVDHFKQAIRDVVLAQHLLFTSKSQILRHDISVDNLMVRYNKDGTVCGVLVDFDLAAKLTEVTGYHTGTRTGAHPFMAWELLESDPPLVHLERFEWESFFCIICWVGCRYSEGKEVNKSALSHWYESDDLKLASMKRGWLLGPTVVPMFTPFYKRVALDWAGPLQLLFDEAKGAKNRFVSRKLAAEPGDPMHNQKFDEFTIGGHVTWDRLWEILKN